MKNGQGPVSFTRTEGACRGGNSPGNNAGLRFYSNRNCEATCRADAACSGYVLPKSNSNWCETYTSVGATGDGRTSFWCYMKGGAPAPTAPPTPAPMSFIRTEGACRGGNSPGNNAGLRFFSNRNCEATCRADAACTGYVLPKSNSNWCETYTSVGATGDGRTSFWCYMKTGGAAPTTTTPTTTTSTTTTTTTTTTTPTTTTTTTTPSTAYHGEDGWLRTVGACRGGQSPGNNAGLRFYSNRNCEAVCRADDNCTGYVLPVSNANWCETYTSEDATGDGRTSFMCYMKAKPYHVTVGACRGGETPAMNAGLVFHRNRDCEDLCNADPNCTGFVLPVSNSNWCETYTSVDATGDGRTSYYCYMKRDGFQEPTTTTSTTTTTPTTTTTTTTTTPTTTTTTTTAGIFFTRTEGACRGGQSPGNNAGLRFYSNRNCEATCRADAACTGYVLPKSNSNWCETYTSVDATGDGRTSFWCYMKGGEPATTAPTTPAGLHFVRTEGACRGGNSPGNNAGLRFYSNRNCEATCRADAACTGYVLPKSNSNWCETYTSVGATGDGRTSFWCYMKNGAAPTTTTTTTTTTTPAPTCSCSGVGRAIVCTDENKSCEEGDECFQATDFSVDKTNWTSLCREDQAHAPDGFVSMTDGTRKCMTDPTSTSNNNKEECSALCTAAGNECSFFSMNNGVCGIHNECVLEDGNDFYLFQNDEICSGSDGAVSNHHVKLLQASTAGAADLTTFLQIPDAVDLVSIGFERASGDCADLDGGACGNANTMWSSESMGCLAVFRGVFNWESVYNQNDINLLGFVRSSNTIRGTMIVVIQEEDNFRGVAFTRTVTLYIPFKLVFLKTVELEISFNTRRPTAPPTTVPTALPTTVPTSVPTTVPTSVPTSVPTMVPTSGPTSVPTMVPTSVPTTVPTDTPTKGPTSGPTSSPTNGNIMDNIQTGDDFDQFDLVVSDNFLLNFDQPEDNNGIAEAVASLLGCDASDVDVQFIQDGDDVIIRITITGPTGGDHNDTINSPTFQDDLQAALYMLGGDLVDRMGLGDNPVSILNVYFTTYPDDICSNDAAMSTFKQNIGSGIDTYLADYSVDSIGTTMYGCEDGRRNLSNGALRARIVIASPWDTNVYIEAQIENGELAAALLAFLMDIYGDDIHIYVPKDDEADMQFPEDGVATIDVAMRLLDEMQVGDHDELVSVISIEGMTAVNYPWQLIAGDQILDGNDGVVSGNIEILEDCTPTLGQECVQRFRINMVVRTICNELSEYDISFPGRHSISGETMSISLEMVIAQNALCGVVIEDAPVSGDIEKVDEERNPSPGEIHLGSDLYLLSTFEAPVAPTSTRVVRFCVAIGDDAEVCILDEEDASNVNSDWATAFNLRNEEEADRVLSTLYLEPDQFPFDVSNLLFHVTVTVELGWGDRRQLQSTSYDFGSGHRQLAIMPSAQQDYVRRQLQESPVVDEEKHDLSFAIRVLPYLCMGIYSKDGIAAGNWLTLECGLEHYIQLYCDRNGWNTESMKGDTLACAEKRQFEFTHVFNGVPASKCRSQIPKIKQTLSKVFDDSQIMATILPGQGCFGQDSETQTFQIEITVDASNSGKVLEKLNDADYLKNFQEAYEARYNDQVVQVRQMGGVEVGAFFQEAPEPEMRNGETTIPAGGLSELDITLISIIAACAIMLLFGGYYFCRSSKTPATKEIPDVKEFEASQSVVTFNEVVLGEVDQQNA